MAPFVWVATLLAAQTQQLQRSRKPCHRPRGSSAGGGGGGGGNLDGDGDDDEDAADDGGGDGDNNAGEEERKQRELLQEYGSRGTSGPTAEAAEQFETLPALRCRMSYRRRSHPSQATCALQ